MKVFLVLFIAIIFTLPATARRSSSDSSSDKALEQTQRLLTNKQKRDAYIRSHKGTQHVDDNVTSLTNGNAEHKEELYSIAADVLSVVTEKAKKPNGEVDVEKMKRLMLQYQQDPEAFYKQMTPEQRKRIKALGKKIGPAPASQN